MTNYYQHNKRILLGDTYLSADDVLLQPSLGIVNSRSEINLNPYMMTAPMDTVTDVNIYNIAIENNVIPVLSRIYLDEMINLIKIKLENKEDISKYFKGFISIGSSIEDFLKIKSLVELIRELFEQNLDDKLFIKIAVDIAHGWSVQGLDQIKRLKELNIKEIMSGSIANPNAVNDLLYAGATVARIGIGGGSMCSTRIMTGCGVPNLSCIFEIFNEAKNKGLILVADGGIRNPGDIVKYLCAGADCVMIGTSFASCLNSPAPIINGKKIHRGQASKSFQMERLNTLRNDCAEGIEKHLDLDMTFEDKVKWFNGGVRSAISYLGGNTNEFLNPYAVKFLRTSHASLNESRPME